jgi:hypothetical protein
MWTRGPLKRLFYYQKNPNLHTNSLKKLLIMNEKFYNCVKKDTLRHFFNAKCVQKWTAMALFLTLFDRFKNHIFYERKRMKKLALFLTGVKKRCFIDLIEIQCNHSNHLSQIGADWNFSEIVIQRIFHGGLYYKNFWAFLGNWVFSCHWLKHFFTKIRALQVYINFTKNYPLK